MLDSSSEGGFRNLWEQVRWAVQDYDLDSLPPRVIIAGLSGAGKKTLFNTLWGRQVITAQPLPPSGADFGLFRLVDLPCALNESESFLYPLALEDASAIVYMLNSARGLTAEDFQWVSRLRIGRAALLVVLNQIGEADSNQVRQIEAELTMRVLPIRASDPDAVRGVFIEALMRAVPDLVTTLAAQIGSVRHIAAQRLIRQACVLGMVVSVEPLPLLDLPLLIGIQLRLLRQLGKLYGQRISLLNDGHTMLAVGFGLLLRYGAQTLMKFIPWGGWIVSGLIGASATWAVGQAAVIVYEERFRRLTPIQTWLKRTESAIHEQTRRLLP